MTKKEIVPSDKERQINIKKNLKEASDNVVDIVGGLGVIGWLTIKATCQVGSFVIKNTPKAIVAVADTRRKISETIVETYEEIQKEGKEKEFDDKFTRKIEQIKLKQKSQD
jgi:hypothetical protein